MKSKSFIKSLGIMGASAVLALSDVNAKPDGDKGKDAPSSRKADQSADKKGSKGDRKDQKRGKQAANKGKADRQTPQGKQGGKQKKKAAAKQDRKDVAVDHRPDQKRRGEFKGRFEDRDRDHVVTYFSKYKDSRRGLPPGLARKWEGGRRLPAGWRERVVTGYVIQDDWYPAFEPVPYTWFPGIAVVPDTRLYWYGDRVIRVYEPTREVVDVVIVPTIHIDL
jgi:hypothetical protein